LTIAAIICGAKLHADQRIEYDRESEMITLSPTGAQEG
jgi:hypothetical protein